MSQIEVIREALSTIEDERACVRAEREAFLAFADEVRALQASTQRAVGANVASVVETDPGRQQLQTVRDCYRETVMSVPDYEAEYGETLRDHMAAEYTDEIATVVVEGTRFTPQVKQLLVEQAGTAARQRADLLESIDTEHESLTDAAGHLRETATSLEGTAEAALIRQSFSELVDHERDLRRGEADCEQLLEDRQSEIQDQNRLLWRVDQPSLQTYLYRDLDETYPVMTATLDLVRRIRSRRGAVIDAIAARV